MTSRVTVATVLAIAHSVLAVDVLTWHNDLARTGQNLSETTLTLANVNSTSFGKLFVVSVDGQVYAQPLVVQGLSIPGQGVHDILYIATEHDSVYAADANTGAAIWQVSLLLPGESPSDSRGCDDLTPELGVTATPVIDRASGADGTIYVVAMSKDSSGNYFQRLHALDLTTGAEEFGGPTTITATYPGSGDNSSGGNVIFDPAQYKDRAGLLLSGGVIYTTWASFCDTRPYTGWVVGYNEATLARVSVLNLTPNGNEGSVWQSGAAPAVDSSGFIYVINGNGTFETTLNANGFPNQGDFGNCFIKISEQNNTLQVADYFTPFNTIQQSQNDVDFGSTGATLLPDMTDSNGIVRHLAVGANKGSDIYIVDQDNMGKFNSSSNSTLYQELPTLLGGNGVFGAAAYFNGTLYFGAVGDRLRALSIVNARVTGLSSLSANSFPYPGTTVSVSANGSNNGIVWAVENSPVAVLHAYDASNLNNELYNSNQAPNSRDNFGAGNKFAVPTVANGKVYVGTSSGGVGVFGLQPVSKQIKTFTKSGSTVTITIDSTTNFNYQLQSTDSLTNAFTNIGNPQSGITGNTLTFTDQNASTSGFYRVMIGP